MFYKMIENKRNQWLSSTKCTITPLIDYIVKTGQMRDAQIEAIKTLNVIKTQAVSGIMSAYTRRIFWLSSVKTVKFIKQSSLKPKAIFTKTTLRSKINEPLWKPSLQRKITKHSSITALIICIWKISYPKATEF